MPPKVDLSFPQQPKIRRFITAQADEVLYGGARGGGKTEAITWDVYLKALYMAQHGIPGVIAVFRRKYRQLEETLIKRALERYDWPKEWFDRAGARYVWYIPCLQGEGQVRVVYGHCHNPHDAYTYKSEEWAFLYVDQAEEFTGEMLSVLAANVRSTDPRIEPKVRYCANPGGPGQQWLIDHFIEPVDDEGHPLTLNPEEGFTRKISFVQDGQLRAFARSYLYIPARYEDNPYLSKEYLTYLLTLAPHLREAWISGNWFAAVDRLYPEFTKETHVRDFAKPGAEMRHRVAVDYGIAAPFCALFAARDPETRRIYIYDELHARGYNAYQQMHAILQRMEAHGVPYEAVILDSAMWSRESSGYAPVDYYRQVLRENRTYLPLLPAQKDRLTNTQLAHWYLALRGDGAPGVIIHPRCRQLSKELATLMPDPNDPEARVIKRGIRDDAHDAFLYLLSSYSRITQRPEAPRIIQRSA